MRIVIFGSNGQLGQELVSSHPRNIEPVPIARAQCDIAAHGEVRNILRTTRAQMVVNAAAYTKVDKAESEPHLAYRANHDGAATLAELCAEFGLPLIHISTDYVFDGSNTEPYTELDAVAPLGVYGISKEAGERAIRERLERHVILRTSWVYGRHGSNFLKTMLRLAEERDRWGVVADQIGNPTATTDLVEAIFAIAASVNDGFSGTYHFAGTGDATWYEFACEIVASQQRYTGRRPTITAISTAEYPTAARRPKNSRLNSELFAAELGVRAREWRLAAREAVSMLFEPSD